MRAPAVAADMIGTIGSFIARPSSSISNVPIGTIRATTTASRSLLHRHRYALLVQYYVRYELHSPPRPPPHPARPLSCDTKYNRSARRSRIGPAPTLTIARSRYIRGLAGALIAERRELCRLITEVPRELGAFRYKQTQLSRCGDVPGITLTASRP